MKTLPILLILLLSGCAYVRVKTPIVEFTSLTVLKDITVDTNGLASTASSGTDALFGLGGLVAGAK